jgi:hypothetical protein
MTLRFGVTAGTALQTLVQQGITIPDKPSYDIPHMPVDLTEVGDEDLMTLYSQYTAYADFITVQVSCAQIDERVMEKNLSALENSKMSQVESTGTKAPVAFARAQVAADPQILSLKQALEDNHAYRKLIEALMANVERGSNLISRELTRRTSNTSRRTNRWSA